MFTIMMLPTNLGHPPIADQLRSSRARNEIVLIRKDDTCVLHPSSSLLEDHQQSPKTEHGEDGGLVGDGWRVTMIDDPLIL